MKSWKAFWAENIDHGVEVCYGIPPSQHDKLKRAQFQALPVKLDRAEAL